MIAMMKGCKTIFYRGNFTSFTKYILVLLADKLFLTAVKL